MSRETIEIDLELSETSIKCIESISQLNNISVSEGFISLLNSGIAQGAEDLESALLKGAEADSSTLEKISELIILREVGNSPINLPTK